MAFLVCSLGATGAVSRYVAEYRSDPAKLAAFIQRWRPWALGLPALSGGAVLIGAWLSAFNLDVTAATVLALWAIASAMWGMQTAALTGFQRFDLIFYSNLLAATILLIGSLLLPITAENPAILFGLMALSAGVAVLPGLTDTLRHKTNEKMATISREQWRSMRSYAFNMWLVALLWSLLWSRGELPLVKFYNGSDGVGDYSTALTLFGGAIQGVMLGVSAVAPQLTRLWGEGHTAEALKTARSVMDLQLLVCGAAASVLIYAGPELLTMVFGPSYRAQSNTLAILSVGLLALPLTCQNHILQIATDGRFNRNTSLIGLLVLTGLALTLIPPLGVSGAALSRSGTMLILGCLSVYTVVRNWGLFAVSIKNYVWAFCLIWPSIIFTLLNAELHWSYRLVLLALSLIILSISIRDSMGRIQFDRIISRLRQNSSI
jgi:O-antigen/teichoic acid export membrane protein